LDANQRPRVHPGRVRPLFESTNRERSLTLVPRDPCWGTLEIIESA
jgi:hypothetical protein